MRASEIRMGVDTVSHRMPLIHLQTVTAVQMLPLTGSPTRSSSPSSTPSSWARPNTYSSSPVRWNIGGKGGFHHISAYGCLVSLSVPEEVEEARIGEYGLQWWVKAMK